MSTPTILVVPGLWEGQEPFEALSSQLASYGYKVHVAKCPSTGTRSPGNPSMSDDIVAIREELKDLVNKNVEVVLVLHSAGGFLGSNAMEGFPIKDRKAKGLKGGVRGIIFITAGLLPEGVRHGPLPFTTVIKDGAVYLEDPAKQFFNDLEASEASKWASKLSSHPAEGWNGTITHAGWQHVPSTYIVCTQDAVIPEAMQRQMAGATASKIGEITAGHMPHVSKPKELASMIDREAKTIGVDG